MQRVIASAVFLVGLILLRVHFDLIYTNLFCRKVSRRPVWNYQHACRQNSLTERPLTPISSAGAAVRPTRHVRIAELRAVRCHRRAPTRVCHRTRAMSRVTSRSSGAKFCTLTFFVSWGRHSCGHVVRPVDASCVMRCPQDGAVIRFRLPNYFDTIIRLSTPFFQNYIIFHFV